MKEITASQAFGIAPPRRPAVLCVRGKEGVTRMLVTEWFSWLNLKHQPMLSFSIARDAGMDLREDDVFWLAFPPVKEALSYAKEIDARKDAQGEILSEGVKVRKVEELPVLIPEGTEIVLCCSLASAYNYPFKKIRIHNCNLDEAFSLR